MPPSRQRKAKRKESLILGLMSGTSADGIDVALVRVGAVARTGARKIAPALENFVTLPYPPAIRKAVLALAEGAKVTAGPGPARPVTSGPGPAGPATSGTISQLNFRLGEMFAAAALRACRRFRVPISRVSLIGSHGQTVYHQGKPSAFLGAPTASTLQLGEPAVIAARTGVITVGDFRPADMAAGGQGAPLVPFVDYLLYRNARVGRIALNIGGIANMTVIPRAARPQDVFAFDTGPGNMLIDGLVQHFTRDRVKYDRGARMARRGKVLPALLEHLLGNPYLRLPSPKTAGREQFGRAYLERVLKSERKSRPEDLIRTATIFTALSIADAFHRWVEPRARISELIVSGGGAHNPLLMAQLAVALPAVAIHNSIALGIPADAKEAFAFALLADETIHGRPANLPSATGARRPAILGKICYPPLR